jgi:uncharacterized protein (TIGR02246 family)
MDGLSGAAVTGHTQYLADRLALQDVMARYAAGVDERDFELYASLFADDVEVVGFAPKPFQGRDAWVAHVRGALERYGATQHLLSPVLAEIDGDHARCRTDVQALHDVAGGGDEVLVLWATYVTDMVRRPDGWQIRRHELIRRAMRTL